MTKQTTIRTALGVLILAGSTLGANAQTDAFDPPPPPDRAPGADILRGPDAPQDARPDRRASFGEDDGRPGADGLKLGAVLREVRSLRGRAVPESAQLTEDQGREIMAIARSYQQDRRAYMEKHEEAFAELRAVLGELAPDQEERSTQGRARGPRQRGSDGAPERRRMTDDDRPARDTQSTRDRARTVRPDRPEPTAEQLEALKQWRELMKEGPDTSAVLGAVMDVLTEEQRRIVGDNLKRRADERERPEMREPNGEGRDEPQRRQRRDRRAPDMDSVDVPEPEGL